jgi:hypothetical protein
MSVAHDEGPGDAVDSRTSGRQLSSERVRRRGNRRRTPASIAASLARWLLILRKLAANKRHPQVAGDPSQRPTRVLTSAPAAFL